MTDQTYDQLAQALHQIRGRLGDAILADRRRLSSLLMDSAPEAKREIRVIGTALDEGVPAALKGAERHLLGMEMDRQANRLESSTGLRLDIALQVVRVLTYALDLGPLPSVYQNSQPVAAPPTTPPANDGWAGISQPTAPQPVNYAPQPVYSQPAQTYTPQGYAPQGYAPQPSSSGPLDKLPFDKKYLFAGGGLLAAIIAAVVIFGGQFGKTVGPDPKVPAVNEQPVNYAGELNDMGVAAKPTLESNVGSPTPLAIPVGRRIATAELQRLIAQDPSTLLVDVLADAHQTTLRGAVYLPLVGYPGTTTDGIQGQVVTQLKNAVGAQPNRPLVFFCAGAMCWESYNAVLRAAAAGYKNVYWYRGGLASWQAAGQPFQPLQSAQPTPPANGAAANMFGP